jgi:hypothetical protein
MSFNGARTRRLRYRISPNALSILTVPQPICFGYKARHYGLDGSMRHQHSAVGVEVSLPGLPCCRGDT